MDTIIYCSLKCYYCEETLPRTNLVDGSKHQCTCGHVYEKVDEYPLCLEGAGRQVERHFVCWQPVDELAKKSASKLENESSFGCASEDDAWDQRARQHGRDDVYDPDAEHQYARDLDDLYYNR
jgi:hypothetical protein